MTATDRDMHNRANVYLAPVYWSLPLRNKALVLAGQCALGEASEAKRATVLDLLASLPAVLEVSS